MLARIKAVAQRYRIAIFVVALTVFLGGVGFAINEAAIDPDKVNPWIFLALLLGPTPMNIALNALLLRYAADALGQTLRFMPALRITVIATASNMLPLPGAYFVRTYALAPNADAASLKRAATINLLVIKQSITLAVLVFAISVSDLFPLRYTIPAILTAAVVLALIALMWRRYGFRWRNFAITVAVQVAMISGEVIRIALAFFALGAHIELRQAAAISIAGIMSSVAAIVPGGVGIRELGAAGIALLIGVIPELAFAATALNWIAALLVLAAANSAITWHATRRKTDKTAL
ncbi:MAG: flippase-like domain-containing protein [Gammaproteobacteria bacterium]|nr:flippase-like domain-containing protein [Gammaproteobacteria bacterium]